jgi:transcriptional regulator with XRE-family HTH domain
MEHENPIILLRRRKGWTQTQMAEHFGVNLSTVWRWENEGIPERGATRKAIERELEAAQ